MQNVRKINSVNDLADYDKVFVTGGEPMLKPELTLKVMQEIREVNPSTEIYLYTDRKSVV